MSGGMDFFDTLRNRVIRLARKKKWKKVEKNLYVALKACMHAKSGISGFSFGLTRDFLNEARGCGKFDKDEIVNLSLHYAALLGYDDVIKVLFENGFDSKAALGSGRTTTHNVGFCQHRDLPTYTVAVSIRNDTDPTAGALHYAAAKGHVDIVKVLIRNGADVNATSLGVSIKFAFQNLGGMAPIDVAVYFTNNNTTYIDTVLYLFCVAGASITPYIRDICSGRERVIHYADDPSYYESAGIVHVLRRLDALHRQDGKKCQVFTLTERKFLYNFAFVLAINYPGRGNKIFYSVLDFMSYDCRFMSRDFRRGFF